MQNSTEKNIKKNLLNVLKNNKINWENNFETLYKQIVQFFGDDIFRELSNIRMSAVCDIKASTNTNFKITKDIEKYIRYFTAKKIKWISETTRKEIQDIIINNLKEGRGVQAIEYELRKTYKDFKKLRSLNIAQTEVAGISNYARLTGAIKYDDDSIKKSWNPILDRRTRPTHEAMEGKEPIPLNQAFRVGGTQMMFPGDPTAPAKEVIRCRCIVDFIKV
ncbi:MAG: phage minor head protein [Candidatus Hodarchaeota archaeon]